MSTHNAATELEDSPVPGSTKTLIQYGSGAPSGTPTAFVYLNITGTTTTTVLYVDVNGTWTALTIS